MKQVTKKRLALAITVVTISAILFAGVQVYTILARYPHHR